VIIDLTATMVPVYWALIGLFVFVAAAIVARIDPEVAEVYFPHARLHLATAILAVLILGAVLLVEERLPEDDTSAVEASRPS
jgi:uncharacterized membrane protein YvlD (DUF360 family)